VPPTQDMSRYVGLFVAEAVEHLEALSRDLVSLERERAPETVDSLFRHAHSVKGMAASMGLEGIATLAHRVEDLVEALRKDDGTLGRAVVDLMLEATDTMRSQVRAAGAGQPSEPPAALLERLSEAVRAGTGRHPAPTRIARNVLLTPEAALPAPAEAQRVDVEVRMLPTSASPGARAFLVYRKLAALGSVVAVHPPLEELRAGAIPGSRLAFSLQARGGAPAVQRALAHLPEVEQVTVSSPSAAPGPPTEASAPGALEATRSVRVRTELLDDFLELAGELLLATSRLREMGKRLPETQRPLLEEGVDRLHGLAKEMHSRVMGARMTPLAVVTDQLPRAVRDVARRRGREVDLVVEGAEIELDRAILDVLAEPLLHVLRNAIDHGIEDGAAREAVGKPARGRVKVTVRRARDRVVVEVEDDGRGMDSEALVSAAVARGALSSEAAAQLPRSEALLLACLPGVSTARDVSDISGRGVGMDAVKRAVERVGGTLELASEPGRGTQVTFRLPLTVAVLQLLLVRVGGEVVGLPITKVLGAVEQNADALQQAQGVKLLRHGSGLVPVHALATLLGFPEADLRPVRPYVVMEADRGPVALAVDGLVGQEEAVVKALSRPLDQLPGLSGVTILGSGRPVFILDVPRLLA
jgi:two-component system, chemotaxis family, sensor kinase CheA